MSARDLGQPERSPGGRVVCLGGATVDRKYHAARALIPGTSNPVEGRRAFGGVARNVAENLARLDVEVGLVSMLGEDEAGSTLLRHLAALGVDVAGVARTAERPTAEYAAVIGPDRDLVLGLADMAIFDLFGIAHLERAWPLLAGASWLFADCNLSADVLAHLMRRKQEAGCKLAIDAVSTPKVRRLPPSLAGIDLLFLNEDEAQAYLENPDLGPIEAAAALRDRGAHEVALTLGRRGAVIATAHGVAPSPCVPAQLVDVTGAGDALVAGTLYRLLRGAPLADAVGVGALLAAITVESEASVHPQLSPRFLRAAMHRIPVPTGAAAS